MRYLAGMFSVILLFSVATANAQDARRKYSPQDRDPYAQAYRSQKLQRFNEERDRYLTIVFNMYFALGCQVFPDEMTVTPLIFNEHKFLIDRNLEFADELDKVGNMSKAKALEGRELAAQPGACDYFKNHPEDVLEFRRAAHAAMGF